MSERYIYDPYESHQEHHAVPLSLGGTDRMSNRVMTPKSLHTLIHQVLNISHSNIRALRKKESENILAGDVVGVLTAQYETQKKYFENLSKLPPEGKRLHSISFVKQIQDHFSSILELQAQISKIYNEFVEVEMINQSSVSTNPVEIQKQHGQIYDLLVLRAKLRELEKKYSQYRPKMMQKPNFLTAGN